MLVALFIYYNIYIDLVIKQPAFLYFIIIIRHNSESPFIYAIAKYEDKVLFERR